MTSRTSQLPNISPFELSIVPGDLKINIEKQIVDAFINMYDNIWIWRKRIFW